MMERVEVAITLGEEETESSRDSGYVSGLVEGIYVWAETGASPRLAVNAVEPSGGRIIISNVSLSNENNEIYPRTLTVTTNGHPVEFSDGFPVAERIPVYGRLNVTITDAQPGDSFNVAIYLSNSNPNGR